MSQIVPYAISSLARQRAVQLAASQFLRKNPLLQTARFINHNAKTIQKYYRRYRMVKRFAYNVRNKRVRLNPYPRTRVIPRVGKGNPYKKRKALRQIANPIRKTGTSKRVVQRDTDLEQKETRTLYSSDITDITKASSLNEINKRQRDIANIAGVKYCVQLYNGLQKPIFFNYAIISPKDKREWFNDKTVDFFRGYENSRGQNFNNALSSNDFRCRPINADRFHVLSHKRFVIGPRDGGVSYTASTRPNYYTFDGYLPIKRQFRYKDGTNSSIDSIFIVYWMDCWDGAKDSAPINGLHVQQRVITYFREPKQG